MEQYAALFQRVAMIMGLAGVKWGQRSEADGLKYTVLWIPIVDVKASRNVMSQLFQYLVQTIGLCHE